MKTFITAFVLIVSLASVVYADDAAQLRIPVSDRKFLTEQIKKALLRKFPGARLQRFEVSWSPESLQCLRVQSGMDPDADMGVCVLSANAFQIDAKFAVIKKLQGYSVSLIYADLE